MNLYQLTTEIEQALASVGDEGELGADFEHHLDKLRLSHAEKVLWLCRAIRNAESLADAASAEIERLRDVAAVAERAKQRMKDWIKDSLKRLNMKRLDVDTFKVWWQKNGKPSVSYDMDRLPAEYVKTKVVKSADTDKIVEDFKAGKKLPDSVLVEYGDHLQMR